MACVPSFFLRFDEVTVLGESGVLAARFVEFREVYSSGVPFVWNVLDDEEARSCGRSIDVADADDGVVLAENVNYVMWACESDAYLYFGVAGIAEYCGFS